MVIKNQNIHQKTEAELYKQWMIHKDEQHYQEMIHQFTYLVYVFLKKETLNSYYDKDLFQEGIIGLIMAIQKCEKDKTLPQFKMYAKLWIRYCIWDYLNRTKSVVHIPQKERKNRKSEQNNTSDICFDESVATSWEDEQDDNPENVIQKINALKCQLKCIQEILPTLKPKEQYVIKKRYLLKDYSFSLVDLSHDLNITKQGIKKIETTALKKIKIFMDEHHFTKEDFL